MGKKRNYQDGQDGEDSYGLEQGESRPASLPPIWYSPTTHRVKTGMLAEIPADMRPLSHYSGQMTSALDAARRAAQNRKDRAPP
jgi:hypothetical protein